MKHPLRPVLVVVVLLMGLSLDHGLPHRYIPDDTVVRCALGIARDLADAPDGPIAALVPPAGKYTTYPYLLPYIDLGALAVTYVAGRVTGRWAGAGNFAEAVFADPGVAWLPGRLVSVLLGLLVPLGIYRAARELGRRRGEAALAALLAGTSLMLVQFAHMARPWAPMMGFGAVTLALSLRLRRRRRMRDVAAAFLAAGLTASTFQVGLFFLPFPVVGWLLALARGPERRRLAVAGAVGAAALVVTITLVGFPHLLVHGADTGSGTIAAEDQDPTLELGGQAFDVKVLRGARFGEALRSWFGYEPVLVLLGFFGAAALCRGPRRLDAALLVLAPAVCFTGIFLLYDNTHVRYLMPASLFLAIGAAHLLRGLATHFRPVGPVVAVVALAIPIVQAARFDQLLGRTDTRTLSVEHLVELIGPDDVAAVDGLGARYGPPLVALAEPLRRVVAEGVWLNRSEQRILALDDAGVPPPEQARHLLPVLRFWKYDSYYPTDYLLGDEPRELEDWMRAWGVTVYVQVDRIPDDQRRLPVTELTRRYGTLVWELSPTADSPPAEAALPTDMAFALTQLWDAERPGPWIRVWRLDFEESGG